MQTETLRELDAALNSAHAIAAGIEQRREDTDPELPRHHRNDTAADAALGGEADLVSPLTGRIVHAAAIHHAEDVLDVARLDRALPGDGIDAGVGECRAHHGQVVTIDERRALLEVEIERLL